MGLPGSPRSRGPVHPLLTIRPARTPRTRAAGTRLAPAGRGSRQRCRRAPPYGRGAIAASAERREKETAVHAHPGRRRERRARRRVRFGRRMAAFDVGVKRRGTRSAMGGKVGETTRGARSGPATSGSELQRHDGEKTAAARSGRNRRVAETDEECGEGLYRVGRKAARRTAGVLSASIAREICGKSAVEHGRDEKMEERRGITEHFPLRHANRRRILVG